MGENISSKISFKKYILGFWILFLSGVLGIALIFLLASWGALGTHAHL